MSVIIKDYTIPPDCPMCPMAHYNRYDEFTGCNIISGKKYAMKTEKGYAETSYRPDWCPLIEMPQLDSIAIGKIVDIFRDRLIEAKTHEFIKKPYAWALYQTWKEIDERGV